MIPVKMGKAYLGDCINVMVQALRTQDGTLPPGLTIQSTYTKLRKGSKKAVVVVQNNTAYLQILQKKASVARAVAALPVHKTPESEGWQERTNESPNLHTPRLTMRQRHGKLFDELGLSSLDFWTPELADTAHWLLAKYHDVFLIGSSKVRLYPFYRAYHKSD